ncbi:hypothetical protein V501_03423 [Pseudogymnoascus sp. VKM F-4519 (FW-2642)]|nr:hypothetical protein V501_03423 [Pseudogymnoascus sp. VKM F-4519 (FW-2642)]
MPQSQEALDVRNDGKGRKRDVKTLKGIVEPSCSVEGAEGAKRRAMSAAGARKLGGRSDGGEGQSRREGVASFIELESGGRTVHARCPIGRAPNPAWHTSRLRLWNLTTTKLTYWLAQRLIFGAGDKIIDDNTEAWCIAKIIRLVGPISPPVNEAFLDEFSLARALEREEYEDPETGVMKQFITVGTVRQELERIGGVPQDLIEFIEYLLVIDHTKRPTARDALGHPYLADMVA